MPERRRLDYTTWIGPAVGLVTILGVLVGAGIAFGRQSQQTVDLMRRVDALERVINATHPNEALADGVNWPVDSRR